jgi:hypothetical protein
MRPKLIEELADKYDHLPAARLTGKVRQEKRQEDILAEEFIAQYTERVQ